MSNEKSDSFILNAINDVSASLWISASAGTGKTKSLINRILALLLNQAHPSKILCLTYTKAAASEMIERLSSKLRILNVMSDDDLKSELISLGFNESFMDIARSLYPKSMSNSWVSIQTIHSFCFKLLERFPLETGLYPGIKLCDNYQRRQLINESIHHVLANDENHHDLKIVSEYVTDIFDVISEESMKFMHFIDKYGNFKQLYATFFDIDVDLLDSDNEAVDLFLFEKLFENEHKEIFAELAEILSHGKTTDVQKAEILRKNSINPTDNFTRAFLTQTGQVFSKLCTDAIKDPNFKDQMYSIALKALDFVDYRKKIDFAKANSAFFSIVKGVIDKFRELKASNHLLDFDDVIVQTINLLKNVEWVMYKIDGGLDHILVDEAQDTSPEQWEVICAIAEEFFSNYQSEKTIFVVGDEKQSIYSFQGADVELFGSMHGYFKQKSESCGQHFYDVPLNKSYRTTGNILSFIDDVFADKFPNIHHLTNRNADSGIVEIVDVFENSEKDELDGSDKSEDSFPKKQSTGKILSDHIVNFIKQKIESKFFVESRGRAALASDFLILFQRRNVRTMRHIISALKNENIPVADIDRIILEDELVVEDLIALAEFSLFPLDDLMCARVLKSPVVGITEDDLMKMCIDRIDRKKEHLWDHIKGDFPILQNYIDQALKLSPYDFFMYVLIDGTKEKFIDRLGEASMDILHEFLNIVINYERENTKSLQSFVEWFRSFTHEIKRESFKDTNAVRLMTAHSSKGLQSPFVILADAHFMKNDKPEILKTEEGLLLWNCSKDLRPKVVESLCTDKQREEEYYRLLYVAMTRAEDFLCILGEKGQKSMGDKCWYNFVKGKLNKFTRIESESLYRLGKISNVNDTSMMKAATATKSTTRANTTAQTNSVEATEKSTKTTKMTELTVIPSWFKEKLPVPSLNIPDADDAPDETSFSKKKEERNHSIIYGNCVHLLLNEMPVYLESNLYDKIADNFVNLFDLSQNEKQAAKIEAYNVMKKFTFLFDRNNWSSLSEMPFIYNGKEGRIDKIVFHDGNLWIVDFKTGIPKENIPEDYILQLRLYKKAVAHILGDNFKITTAILWTQNQKIVKIPSNSND